MPGADEGLDAEGDAGGVLAGAVKVGLAGTVGGTTVSVGVADGDGVAVVAGAVGWTLRVGLGDAGAVLAGTAGSAEGATGTTRPWVWSPRTTALTGFPVPSSMNAITATAATRTAAVVAAASFHGKPWMRSACFCFSSETAAMICVSWGFSGRPRVLRASASALVLAALRRSQRSTHQAPPPVIRLAATTPVSVPAHPR